MKLRISSFSVILTLIIQIGLCDHFKILVSTYLLYRADKFHGFTNIAAGVEVDIFDYVRMELDLHDLTA